MKQRPVTETRCNFLQPFLLQVNSFEFWAYILINEITHKKRNFQTHDSEYLQYQLSYFALILSNNICYKIAKG